MTCGPTCVRCARLRAMRREEMQARYELARARADLARAVARGDSEEDLAPVRELLTEAERLLG